jgi:GNAT superfamily N-acetyltransferase
LAIELAQPSHLASCAALRTASILSYRERLGIPYEPPNSDDLVRQLGHLLATDPSRFFVAGDNANTPVTEIVGMAAAIRRGPAWFLSALYIAEPQQGRGLGKRLLQRALADDISDSGLTTLATCTDSLQPVSNALYARHGLVPREPFFQVAGRWPDRIAKEADSVLTEASMPEQATPGWNELADEFSRIDRSVLGFERPADHAFFRSESRIAWTFRFDDGELAGYGYARVDGTIGPVAVVDPEFLAPLLRRISSAFEPTPVTFWLAGSSSVTLTRVLSEGLQLHGYPAFGCWTRPFIDLSRYVPWNLMLP